MIHKNYKIIIFSLLAMNLILFFLNFYFLQEKYGEYFTKFLGIQGIAFSSLVGAFVRWKSINSKKTLEDFFFDTNFLLNAQLGVIVVGIPAFVIWVFFIR